MQNEKAMLQKNTLNVFCAEDQALYAEMVVTLFENEGHVIEHAEDGQKVSVRPGAS